MEDYEVIEGGEEIRAEVNPMAAKLGRHRYELDAFLGNIEKLSAGFQLALQPDDPVPMTPLQVKRDLGAVTCLISRMDSANNFLIKHETDPAKMAGDATALEGIMKVCAKATEAGQTVQAVYEATQQASVAEKTISRMEKKQAENPTRDYSKSMTLMDNQLSDVRTTMIRVGLSVDHVLWEQLSDLEDRLQNLLSFEVTPPDTKDFTKMFRKNPYKITDLVVPKFSGKIEHWIAFWEEYQHAVDNKSDMDVCTKLVYLKQAILDPGLKLTVADLGIQEKSYAAAVKLLKDRFNKPRIIHRQCCEAIKAISTNDNTRISLTKMADNVQHILTGLTRLESLDASEILTSMTELAMNKYGSTTPQRSLLPLLWKI